MRRHGREHLAQRIERPCRAAGCMKNHDSLAGKCGITHQPIEGVFKGSGQRVYIFWRRYREHIGSCDKTSKPRNLIGHALAVEVRIEMWERANLLEMREAQS